MAKNYWDGLPVELMEEIHRHLSDDDLHALSLTSKAVRDLVFPLLWRHCVVAPNVLPPMPRVALPFPTRDLLQYTNHLEFRWPRCLRRVRTCPHREGYNKPFLLGQQMRGTLAGIEKNQLESFSWKYGSCVPSLLERCDFLARQKTLKHLEVVTDADCPAESSIYRMINLDAFRSLTSLSWTAPKESFLPDIYVAIAANERHLQVLELNFHPHSEMDALGEDTRLEPKRENFASWLNKLAALPQAAHSKPLPSLHTLKLCNRYLSGDTAEYMADMDLQSLTLQDCPGWKGFLYAVLARNPAPFPRLAKLQIQETGGSADTVFDDSLVLFLLSTGPLDTMLFKLFSREDVNAAAWETVLHHKATLRNFVLHRRFMLPRSPYEHFFSRDDTRDTHWWIPPPFAPERNPLGECPLLEFFGASHTPKTMLELLDTSPKCEALKVVHIRHSARDRKLGRSTALDSAPADRPDADEGGPVKRRKRSACGCKWYPLTEELRSFADWAFGPAGLPSLQFIVYGDFAKYVRFKSENVVLRRTSQTGAAEYETLQCLHTIMSCRQLSEYRDLLECCPSEDVM